MANIEETKELLDGHVIMHGEPSMTYEQLSVHIYQGNISIPRLSSSDGQLNDQGPHFQFLCLTSALILNSISLSPTSKFSYEFNGPVLGYLERYHGHTALELGMHIHRVTNLKFSFELLTAMIKFYISGTVSRTSTSAKVSVSGDLNEFDIEFNVPDENIQSVMGAPGIKVLEYKSRYFS